MSDFVIFIAGVTYFLVMGSAFLASLYVKPYEIPPFKD